VTSKPHSRATAHRRSSRHLDTDSINMPEPVLTAVELPRAEATPEPEEIETRREQLPVLDVGLIHQQGIAHAPRKECRAEGRERPVRNFATSPHATGDRHGMLRCDRTAYVVTLESASPPDFVRGSTVHAGMVG